MIPLIIINTVRGLIKTKVLNLFFKKNFFCDKSNKKLKKGINSNEKNVEPKKEVAGKQSMIIL